VETLESDVWVVGSGAAGLMAAVAAREAGARVGVVGKHAPGQGTSTILSVGAFAGAWEGVSETDHKQRTLGAGRGINDEALVDVLVRETPARFRDLLDWGMRAESSPGYLLAMPEAEAADKAPMWGREIVRCLGARAEALGATFVNGLVVCAIDADEKGARLLAYSATDGRWVGLSGGAVVLAAGGGGGLYLHHDNPQRITGDAYALAYGAGAAMRDMEFVQFYPIAINEPGKPTFLIAPDGADMGRIVNGSGEEILEKYGITERPAATFARDKLSQALFKETEIDGGDVYLDLTDVSKETWCSHPVAATKWAYLGKRYDAWNKPLRIAPVAHFVAGGAVIDADGRTSVPGLFAAGEAAGGLHGANRMGGNALSETVVFGHRAGRAAAALAAGRGSTGGATGAALEAMVPASTGASGADPDTLRTRLQTGMWRCGGIDRDAAGLARGLQDIRAIAAEASGRDGVNDPIQFRKLLEIRLAAGASELILEAATRREESRGVHFRSDFPAADDRWRGSWAVALGQTGPEWRFEPLAATTAAALPEAFTDHAE
jgi:aspartate oxidase